MILNHGVTESTETGERNRIYKRISATFLYILYIL